MHSNVNWETKSVTHLSPWTMVGAVAWVSWILCIRWIVWVVKGCVLLVFTWDDCRCNLAWSCDCCNCIVFAKTMPGILFRFWCSCCFWIIGLAIIVFALSLIVLKFLALDEASASWNDESDCCVCDCWAMEFCMDTIVGTQTNVCCSTNTEKSYWIFVLICFKLNKWRKV